MGCAMSKMCCAGVRLSEDDNHPFDNLEGRCGQGGDNGTSFGQFEGERQQWFSGDAHGQLQGTNTVLQVGVADDGNTTVAAEANDPAGSYTVPQVPSHDENSTTAADAELNSGIDTTVPVPGQNRNNATVTESQLYTDSQRAELMDRAAREVLPPREYAKFMEQTHGTGVPTPPKTHGQYHQTMNDIYGKEGSGKIVAKEITPLRDLNVRHVTFINPTVPNTIITNLSTWALYNEAGSTSNEMRNNAAVTEEEAISRQYQPIPTSIKEIKQEIKALQLQLNESSYVNESVPTLEHIGSEVSLNIKDHHIHQLLHLRSRVRRELAKQNLVNPAQATAQKVLDNMISAQVMKENVPPSITTQAAHEESAITIKDLKGDSVLWYRLHVLAYDARHEAITYESHSRLRTDVAHLSGDEAEKVYRLPVPAYILGVGPGIITKPNNIISVSEEGTGMTTLGKVINSRRYEAVDYATRKGLPAENGWKATFYKNVAPFMEYAIGIRDRGYQLENRVWFLKMMLDNGLDVTVDDLKDWDTQMVGIDGETGTTTPFSKASYWRQAGVQSMRTLSEWLNVAEQ